MTLLLAKSFVAKTYSKTWLGGNSASNLCYYTFFFKQIAQVFLNMDSKVIGLRFSIGPFDLPGFWITVNTP